MAAAAPTRCPTPTSSSPGVDAPTWRKSARAAAEFGGAAGDRSRAAPGVAIRLVERTGDGGLGAGERARYETGSHAIVLLGYAATARATPPGPAEGSAAAGRAVWRSYVVHELAHAAIHLSCVSTCPRRAVHEYVAAVAQYATFRRTFGRTSSAVSATSLLGGSEAEISDTYYAVDPGRFAVKSYLHYRQPQAGPEFVRRLVRGGDR
ncbi:MAG: hypothetical protein IPJ62_05855 [Betaproteobacteria bacterium]|nr:hypothetical protein [Betaproteobacteria bacterium]